MNERELQREAGRASQTPTTAGLDAVLRRLLRDGPEPLEGPVAAPAPNCPICNDLGRVYADPDGITTKLCECRVAAWEAGKVERLQRHWENVSGIPKSKRGLRLETHPNLTEKGANPGLLSRLLTADVVHASWFFWGDNSVGKTGLAVGYAWMFLNAAGESVCFRAVPDLLAELRATYDRRNSAEDWESEADLMYRYKTAGLLVLDDLGAERIAETADPANTWVADRLYTILNHRLGAELPTVFTSNHAIKAVRERVGPRVSERVIEMADRGNNIVHVQGKNLRYD